MLKYCSITIIFVFLLCLTSPKNALNGAVINNLTNESDLENDVVNFVNEIKNNIDFEADPCDDFYKYACGSNIRSMNGDKYHRKIDSILEQINGYSDESVVNEADKNIRDLNATCEIDKAHTIDEKYFQKIFNETDILKTYKSFPVKDYNVSSKSVAELEAFLNSFGAGGFFYLTPKTHQQMTLELNPRLNNWNFENISDFIYPKENNAENIEQEVAKVSGFINKLQSLMANAETTDDIEINSFKELKDIFPFKHFDWDTFEEGISKEWNLQKLKDPNKIKIKLLAIPKAITDLFNSIDLKTFLNFQIIFYLYTINSGYYCNIVENINSHRVAEILWKENLNSKRTIDRYTNYLNDFENNFNKITIKSNHNLDNYTKTVLSSKRYILENYKNLVEVDYIVNFHKNYENKNIYKNIHRYANYIAHFLLQSDQKYHLRTFEVPFDDLIETDVKNKPYLYYYSNTGFNLWYEFFHSENFYKNSTIIYEYLKTINENFDYRYESEDFISAFAAIKSTLIGFEESKLLVDELEYKNFLELSKLLFISLGQNICQTFRSLHIDSAFRAFRHFKEFSNAFSCPTGSRMNQYKDNIICDDDVCNSVTLSFEVFLPCKCLD